MRAQRPPHVPHAVDAVAENLPFPDRYFDAAMATFTIHQWSDLDAGLRQMRRVTAGPIIILTCDPAEVERFWLNDYAPLVLATEARRYPTISSVAPSLGGDVQVRRVPIPLHCVDGFNEAYYGRPERLLDPGARQACSAWSFVEAALADSYVARLQLDLTDGSWDRKYGLLRQQPHFDGSLRLIIAS
jgi:SAM-dependent methyltransferase